MTVGQLQICTRSNQELQGFLVPAASVAEHDRFNCGRPVQVVHVVQRRAGSNQLTHHAVVAQMRGCDQRCAVVAAGDLPGAGTQSQQHAQRVLIVGYRGNGHAVIAVLVQQIDIGAGLHQRANRGVLSGEGRHMQRCAAVAVAGIEVGCGGNDFFNLGHIALVGGRVQAFVGGHLGGVGGDLGCGRHDRHGTQPAGSRQRQMLQRQGQAKRDMFHGGCS